MLRAMKLYVRWGALVSSAPLGVADAWHDLENRDRNNPRKNSVKLSHLPPGADESDTLTITYTPALVVVSFARAASVGRGAATTTPVRTGAQLESHTLRLFNSQSMGSARGSPSKKGWLHRHFLSALTPAMRHQVICHPERTSLSSTLFIGQLPCTGS